MQNRILVLVALLVLFLGGCGKPAATNDADLQQAERVARYLTSTRFLNRTAYRDVREKSTPSELVSFLFSDLGIVAWPPAEDSDPREKEMAQSTGVPLFPKGASIVHSRYDPQARPKQLVLNGDDASGEIVAEFYLGPGQPPVATLRWPMAKSD